MLLHWPITKNMYSVFTILGTSRFFCNEAMITIEDISDTYFNGLWMQRLGEKNTLLIKKILCFIFRNRSHLKKC